MSACPSCGASADMYRPEPGMHVGRLPARIVDLLECDGGWLTTAGVGEDLSADYESVKRALGRLRDRGLVQSRLVILVFPSRYIEWKLA